MVDQARQPGHKVSQTNLSRARDLRSADAGTQYHVQRQHGLVRSGGNRTRGGLVNKLSALAVTQAVSLNPRSGLRLLMEHFGE
jgi:hypothetical protein